MRVARSGEAGKSAAPKLAVTVSSPPPLSRMLLARTRPRAFGDGERPGQGRLGQQQRELLAAEPGDRVRRTHRIPEPLGQHHEHVVPHAVPVPVVDELEVVEVDDHERAGMPPPDRAFELDPERTLEAAPVRRPRERVEHRLFRDRGNAIEAPQQRSAPAPPHRGRSRAARSARRSSAVVAVRPRSSPAKEPSAAGHDARPVGRSRAARPTGRARYRCRSGACHPGRASRRGASTDPPRRYRLW